jgi:hypothetical protein
VKPIVAIDEQNAQKQASVLDFRRIDLLPIAGEWAATAKKTSLLVIAPGGIHNLLIDKEN